MRINKNNNDFTLILSEKAGLPTSPSSILTKTGDKGEDHGRKGTNQQKKGKETEGKQEQQWKASQLKTPPRKATPKTKSGMVNMKITNNFRNSVGSRKNYKNKNKNKNKNQPTTLKPITEEELPADIVWMPKEEQGRNNVNKCSNNQETDAGTSNAVNNNNGGAVDMETGDNGDDDISGTAEESGGMQNNNGGGTGTR